MKEEEKDLISESYFFDVEEEKEKEEGFIGKFYHIFVKFNDQYIRVNSISITKKLFNETEIVIECPDHMVLSPRLYKEMQKIFNEEDFQCLYCGAKVLKLLEECVPEEIALKEICNICDIEESSSSRFLKYMKCSRCNRKMILGVRKGYYVLLPEDTFKREEI